MQTAFQVIPPVAPKRPILVSVPHCGTAFPEEVREAYHQELIEQPDDTDWFVEQLYDFASEMGITLIHSVYSRYVIDLNRDPQSKPLYDDGRVITALVPTQTFHEEPLYVDGPPDTDEIERRKAAYYIPYHAAVEVQLASLQESFSNVLLWEAHSIRRKVPSIRAEPFPDMILGNADMTSASPPLCSLALETLQQHWSGSVWHNTPFKGGYLTRSFGQPARGRHALQLEMSKDLYMDEDKTVYTPARANQVREALQATLSALCDALEAT